MEVCTKEEVHLLTLLPDLSAMHEWELIVAPHRATGRNIPEIFGRQWICSPRTGDITEETALLSAPTTLSVDEVVDGVDALGGHFGSMPYRQACFQHRSPARICPGPPRHSRTGDIQDDYGNRGQSEVSCDARPRPALFLRRPHFGRNRIGMLALLAGRTDIC